ncbi:MAG: type II secretion system protein GspE, partial [Planctomycetota bacterium]
VYKDRTAIYEILLLDDQIRSFIMSRRTASEIKQYALSRNFITLRMDGARKVLKGITTIEEVLRVTQVDISER